MPSLAIRGRRLASLRPLAAAALLLTSAACGGDPASNAATSGGVTTSSGSTSSGTGGGEAGGTGGGTGTGGAGGSAMPAPGIVFLDVFGAAMDVTPDGRTVLIQTLDTGEVLFYDTVTNELTSKTTIGEPATNSATAISATLRVIGSEGLPIQAGIWSEDAGWIHIGEKYPQGCDAFVADGWDLSADGKVAVGMVWNGCHTEAFRWTDTGDQGDLQMLEILGTGFMGKPPSNRATKVADDGSMMGGFAENTLNSRVPAAWNADGTGFLLDPADTGMGEVLAISADGKILGGYLGYEAFTWTAGGGMVSLERLPGVDPTSRGLVNAVVANGDLVFGRYGDPKTGATAFVWTRDAKTRALQDVISAAGIVIPPEYTMWNVTGASTDGSVVVGIAYGPMGPYTPFALRMPPSAYAP
jgi:hypothetical protein